MPILDTANYPLSSDTAKNVAGVVGLTINVLNYGADPSGATDSTAAIQAAEAAATPGQQVYFPPGTYTFASSLAWTRQRFCWKGAGFGQSILKYIGGSTTIDLFLLGDGITALVGATISGLTLQSTTKMTAGAGAHFQGVVRSNISFQMQGQDAALSSNNLWNGAWFDGADNVNFEGDCFAQNDCFRVNGSSLGSADLRWYVGKVGFGAGAGIHVGGGFGGLYLGPLAVIDNATNLLVDKALYAVGNRELFFQGTIFDVNTSGPSIIINDSGGPYCFFTGAWINSAFTQGVDIQSCPGFIQLTGCHMGNCGYQNGGAPSSAGDAIRISDANAVVDISGCQIVGNYGWGINATVAGCKYTYTGDISGNVLGQVNTAYPTSLTGVLGGAAIMDILTVRSQVNFSAAATFYAAVVAGNPTIAFAANDYLAWNASASQLQAYVGGTESFVIGQGYYANGPALTVGTLPSASTYPYARAFVTDSTLTAAGNYGATIATHGGGANVVPVYSDSVAWRIG